jgi:cytochrome c6
MSRNDIILGAVALVLVAFSLLVSMVIPRRNPEFPGRHLKLFTLVCVLLVIAMLAAVELFGAEEGHGAQEEENVATAVQDSGEPDAEEGSETGAQTEAGETGETAGGDPAAGEEIFASAGCANCHVLEAAGAAGTIGPNLDEAQLGADEVAEQVTTGGNGMPAYGDQLSPAEIADVAAFVVESAGG